MNEWISDWEYSNIGGKSVKNPIHVNIDVL